MTDWHVPAAGVASSSKSDANAGVPAIIIGHVIDLEIYVARNVHHQCHVPRRPSASWLPSIIYASFAPLLLGCRCLGIVRLILHG